MNLPLQAHVLISRFVNSIHFRPRAIDLELKTQTQDLYRIN